MASAYLPVLLVSVSTNVVPDDSTLVTLPRGQVDYLSHEWQEEDVWRSWRNMTRQKNEIANGARLENASWRTWWKQRNKLKTVSPETLNWLKDSDVTWLYGPLHTAVEWTPPPKPVAVPDSVDAPTNADAHSRLHLARPRARPSAPVTKPILKHRSISELLTSDFPNPTSPIFSPPESDDEHDSVGSPDAAGTGTHAAKLAAQLSAKRPPLPHTKSDTHIIRWGASRAFRPSSPPRIDPPGHAPAGTDSAAGSTTANPPKKKHISFNTFVEQCIAIEKPKKNASGFFNVGMDPMGAWNQGAGFVDDDGYDEDQEDEDLDEEDEDEGWDGSGARAIRSDSDEDSGSNPEEDEPGGQRAIGVIQEDDEDEEEEDDDDDDVLQMRTPRSHSSMSNATVTLAGTGALDPATSSTTDSTLTASNATPRTTKKQPRSQSVSTASSSSSSTSATTTTSGPSAPSTSASSPASSLSPARREGSTRRKGSLSPGTDSAKNGEGEVPPATAAGRPRHRRRTAAQPTSAVGMSRTRSSSSSHSRGGHVTIAPIAPTMLKTGGAWEESFGDEGGSDDGLGYGYTYSPGTESVLDGRWTWNEGRGKRTSSGGGVKKSGNTRYPQREKTGDEGEGTHDGDADAVANTRANAVSPRPKSTKERENYRAEKATPVELVYAPPKGSGYAAYGYGQGGMYGGYGPNSNGTHADLRNNVDNNGSSNASANWTPGPSAYAEGSMADAGAAYGYAPGARGGGMGVYAGYGCTTLGGYSGKNGFSDEGAEEERVEVVEDDGDGPVVSAGTSSAQTTTPPIGIPISQPAHVGDDGFLLGSAPRTSGSGMEALERSRGRGRQDNYFAYPYAHAASYQPTTVGQEEHVRQQHAAETLLQQRLLARQPTPYVDEEDATDFFGAGADYFYARRGGRGYEPASARSGFMDEDGQIEDVRGADPVRGAQDELHARERGGYLVPPTATRGRTDDERPSRSRSRSHSRTPSPAFLAANTAVNATPSGHPGAAAAPSPAPAIPPSTAATTGRRRSASASNPSTPGTWMSAAAALPTPEHLLALQSPASLLAQARPSTGRTSSQNASGQGQQRVEPQRASPPQQPQVQQGERRGRSSTRTPSASSSSWERERGTSIGSSPIGSLSPDTAAQAAPIEAVLGGSAGALAGGGRERREDGERGRERGRERRGRDRTSGKVGASLAANPPPVGLGLVNAEGDGEVESSCGSSVAGDAQSTSTAQSVSIADSSSSAGRPTVVDASVYAPSSGSSSATITGQGQQRPATPTLAIPGRFPADEADVAHVDVLQAHENPVAAELRHLRRAEEEQRRRVHPTPSNSPVVEVRRMAPVQRTSTASSSSGSGGTTPTSTTPSPSPSATTPRGLSPSTKTKQLRPPPLVPSPPVPAKPSTSFTAVSSPRRAVAPILPSVSGVVGPASPVAAPVPTHAPAADTIVAKAVDIMSSAGAYLRLWGHNDAA